MITEHKAATQLSHNQHFNLPHFLLLLYNCCTIEKVFFQFQIEAPKHLIEFFPFNPFVPSLTFLYLKQISEMNKIKELFH